MRLDQWLWAVRLFKSRGLAVDAIKCSHVKVNGATTKPSHTVKPEEIVTAFVGRLTRTFRVLGAPKSRVGAKLVPQFAEDLTPPEEYERLRAESESAFGLRAPGAGRPTKRERRELDEFAGDEVD